MVSLTNAKKAPMAVPILFVPGIMGSRLCNEDGEVVWDPPEIGFSFKFFGAMAQGVFDSPDDRKQRLIGEPGDGFNKDFLHVAGTTTSASHKADKKYWKGVVTAPPGPEKIQLKPTRSSLPVALSLAEQPHRSRGWGTVHWESYGRFLQSLEDRGAEISQSTGNCHVYLPVYACGYNWTASSADSAQTLSDWIDVAKAEMAELGLPVEKVLIISHSMGGFVSRYCTMGKTARAKDVHAICHIAMPDNGSPATYKRMKAGFEGSEKIVLGANGREVTAVLAHAPGGLELLPNTHYRQADGSQGCWLTLEDRDEALPLFQGSPYDSVYKEADKWWRLITPAWVEPSDEIDDLGKNNYLKENIFKMRYYKPKSSTPNLVSKNTPTPG
ncbi:PGAP1-like alpha/beta domain-containing protein [Candidatus Vondammii sp. HM_W22]|uniref:PGAP1-like alpha/beta domain-containing protein n=1 Tax=Candidatus Vondammii sp. HM_W22 TaxID=2687299 RepID=UPI002E7B79E6|nr:hypothetical protein [Candidatus Vondammii sp. HM_W22]